MSRLARLRADVIAEPLVNQWYAWNCLIPPATAARYLSHSQLQVLQSFVEAPEVHASALRDPNMIGGPFIQYGKDRLPEIRELLERSRREQQALLALSAAIERLDRQLAEHPAGAPMQDLYRQLPEPLRGFVELVYDARNCPLARYQEGLLYRSAYYRPENQALALLQLADSDKRAFVMSTPRLERDVDVMLRRPFANRTYDELFRSRHTPVDVEALADAFELAGAQRARFHGLFTDRIPAAAATGFDGNGLRVRYLGHACVLVETANVAILVDPLLSYDHPTGLARFSYADLPEFIDYVLITHNHQDHIMFETLLQIRHKVGQILIPSGHRGNLLEPSLRLILRQIGFGDVREADRLDNVEFAGGAIISLPFLGEHGDLDIAAKTAWRIEAAGRSVLCVADSDNLDPDLYRHIAHLYPELDILFIGMECEGAPYTWSYGPLLPDTVPHRQAQQRRLNGSNAERAEHLVDILQPAQVYVYAMGQEPWLNYITSIHYTEDSLAIVESNRLVRYCQQRGLPARRLFGKAEFLLEPRPAHASASGPIPARIPAAEALDRPADLPRPPQDSVVSRYLANAAARRADPVADLLDELGRLHIKLLAERHNLRVNAPKGVLTSELTGRIKQHKPALLALLQQRHGNGEPGMAAAQTESPLPEDARLPASLAPAAAAPVRPYRHILLTGATGFIGAYLLRELLAQTDAHVYCLLRYASQADPDAGMARLKNALNRYGIWTDAMAHRLTPVAGDLAEPGLGLRDADRRLLETTVDAVYHNGAQVHHVLPYERLRAANVAGTLEILRLACGQRPMAVHFISSLSVLPPAGLAQGRRFRESDPLDSRDLPTGGYNRSKWMAEQLVRQAHERGLPGSILRPGPIAGDSISGAFNDNDFLIRLLRGYLQTGMAPVGNPSLDLLPVDYLARAAVYISLQAPARGGVFHLLHPQPVSAALLFAAIERAGYELERVSYPVWHAQLRRIAREQPDHPLYPLAALFGSRDREAADALPETAAGIPYDSARAQALLAQAPFPLPALNVELFLRYLAALERGDALAAGAC